MTKDFGGTISIDDFGPNNNGGFYKHGDNNDSWNGGNVDGLNFDAAHVIETSGTIDASNDISNYTKA